MNVGKITLAIATGLAIIGVVFAGVASAPSPAPVVPSAGGYCVSLAHPPKPGHRYSVIAYRIDNPSESSVHIRGLVPVAQRGLSSVKIRFARVTKANVGPLPGRIGIAVASTVTALADTTALSSDSSTTIPPHGTVAVIAVLTLAPGKTLGKVSSFALSYDGRLGIIQSTKIPLALAFGETSADCTADN